MARKYIANTLGPAFAEPVVLNLEATWGESEPRVPLVCFLSMGSDPTNQIEALSKKLELPFAAISMGQGQEIHARTLIHHSLEHVSVAKSDLDMRNPYMVCSIREDGYCCRIVTLDWISWKS